MCVILANCVRYLFFLFNVCQSLVNEVVRVSNFMVSELEMILLTLLSSFQAVPCAGSAL